MNPGGSRPRFGRSLKPLRRPRLWMAAWAGLIAVVVVLSLIPPPPLPELPSGSDKLEHFLAYFVLAAGAVQLFARRLSLFSACIVLALMGWGLEQLQAAMVLGRQADVADALANSIGVLAGLATLFTPWRDALLRFDRRQ